MLLQEMQELNYKISATSHFLPFFAWLQSICDFFLERLKICRVSKVRIFTWPGTYLRMFEIGVLLFFLALWCLKKNQTFFRKQISQFSSKVTKFASKNQLTLFVCYGVYLVSMVAKTLLSFRNPTTIIFFLWTL